MNHNLKTMEKYNRTNEKTIFKTLTELIKIESTETSPKSSFFKKRSKKNDGGGFLTTNEKRSGANFDFLPSASLH